MQDVDIGGILHGHKLIEKVGRGHYGEVWRAEYMGHEVALKIFTGDRKPAHLRREVFRGRLVVLSQGLASLSGSGSPATIALNEDAEGPDARRRALPRLRP